MSPQLKVVTMVLLLAFGEMPGQSCEPILPLVQLLGGGTLAGPMLLTQSLVWLGLAVALKCAAFAAMEQRLPWKKAVWWMLLANAFSTIPGLLVAVFAGSLSGILFALAIVYGIGWMVRRRVTLLAGPHPPLWISGGGAALLFTAFFFVSILMFELAQGALAGRNFATYWALKFLFVTLVAGTGMLISAVLEEYVIARLARNSFGKLAFFTPVLRANYLMLTALLLVAALQTLPERVKSPHWIVSWRQASAPGLNP